MLYLMEGQSLGLALLLSGEQAAAVDSRGRALWRSS